MLADAQGAGPPRRQPAPSLAPLELSRIQQDAVSSLDIGKRKRVEFDGTCMVIPNVEHKQLLKLLKLYAVGCDRTRDENDGSPATRPAPPKALKSRYGLRMVSVPLSPGQWGGGNIRSSLANLNIGSKIDFNAVASGLAPASGSWGGTTYRGSSSSTSVNEIKEDEDRGSTNFRDLRRARSLSDDDRRLRPDAESELRTEADGGAEDHYRKSVAVPASPRVLRMKLPTFGGWRKAGNVSDARPAKGCLLNKKAWPSATAAGNSVQKAMSPSPKHEVDELYLRERVEGPPVRETTITPMIDYWQHRPAAETPSSPAVPLKSPGSSSLAPLLRRAGSLGRRSSARREGSEMSDTGTAGGGELPTLSNIGTQPPPPELDEAAIKRELNSGRWPFQQPLNPECNCKDCAKSISLVNMRGYRPQWTRSARAKWLADRKDGELYERSAPSSPAQAALSGRPSNRPSSRGRIQADEVDLKRGTGSRPQTPQEDEAEDSGEQNGAGHSSGAAEPEAAVMAADLVAADSPIQHPESDPVDKPVDSPLHEAAVQPTHKPNGEASNAGIAAPPAPTVASKVVESPISSPTISQPSRPTLLVAPKPVLASASMFPIIDDDDDVGYMEGDEQLQQEIESRRASMDSRQSQRSGARSMMRQLEEADRIERAASAERERRRSSNSPLIAWSPPTSPSPRLSPRPSPRPSPQPGLHSHSDMPRARSPLASPRPLLSIAETTAKANGHAGERQVRSSPLRIETPTPVTVTQGPEPDRITSEVRQQADKLLMTPSAAESAEPIGIKVTKAGPGGKAKSVTRRASKSFFGLLGSSFGGSGAPPG